MKEEKDITNKMDLLEDIASQELLVELVNSKKDEVFKNIVFEGKRRYYIEDLTQRDYTLENTTPYQFKLGGHIIEEKAWTKMSLKIARLLLNLYPYYGDTIIHFCCSWSKATIISRNPKENYKEIYPGLYLNCNHTALHSCWLIQDLLDYFNIDKSAVSLLIHRPCSVEPQEVKNYVEKRFKRGFVEFIMLHYKVTEEQANNVVMIIGRYLNPILSKISRSYTNLFLFDDYATLTIYIKKIREQIIATQAFSEKVKTRFNKCLDWLLKYYKA